jgi:hypothetical protein
MNDIGAYTMIGLGAFAVIWLVVGLFFGGEYYASMVGPVGKRKPIPKWGENRKSSEHWATMKNSRT